MYNHRLFWFKTFKWFSVMNNLIKSQNWINLLSISSTNLFKLPFNISIKTLTNTSLNLNSIKIYIQISNCLIPKTNKRYKDSISELYNYKPKSNHSGKLTNSWKSNARKYKPTKSLSKIIMTLFTNSLNSWLIISELWLMINLNFKGKLNNFKSNSNKLKPNPWSNPVCMGNQWNSLVYLANLTDNLD